MFWYQTDEMRSQLQQSVTSFLLILSSQHYAPPWLVLVFSSLYGLIIGMVPAATTAAAADLSMIIGTIPAVRVPSPPSVIIAIIIDS